MRIPFKLKPVLLDYIWGGDKLKSLWNKQGATQRIAESWELSCLQGKESVIAGGEYDGKTLAEYLIANPEAAGKKVKERFPLLVKLIDATGNLSVQVHPNDDYALANENQLGKTEVWYIADAQEGASIYYGFNRDVSGQEIRDALSDGTLCGLLNLIPVKTGDVFFVEAGTVHALLAGITVIEIQQSSGLTYRLYDYDRKDADGNPRELHIDKAIAVADRRKKEIPNQEKGTSTYKDYKIRQLADCQYFKTREIDIDGIYPIYNGNSFVTFTVAEGEGVLFDGNGVQKGDTVFVPAECDTSVHGKLKIIETTI